jgi:NADH-quinone oxidoreductase subunit D
MSRITIPIGPQHPALKEPGNFELTVEGEQVVDAKVNIGYNHRGVEKACEERTYIQDIYLIERICGICSHSHTSCFCQAVEEIAGVEVPARGLYIRTLIGELERIHSHFLWLGVAGHEIGFDTLLMYSWRDREIIMDILAMISGNRVNYAMNTIGGVRRDVTDEHIRKIRESLPVLEKRTKYYLNLATEETTFLARAKGVGMLTKEDAMRLGAVGPTARASGVDRDVRRDDPYAAYAEIPFKVITMDTQDVLGRTAVRVLEILQCYKMIAYIIDNLPEGDIRKKVSKKIPAGEAVSRYEAPRGEDIHYIASNGTDKPERVKVRAPTLANWPSIAHTLVGHYIADVPLVLAAIDPCFGCADRSVTMRNGSKGEDKVWEWEDLRRYGIEWYRKQGVDFHRVRLDK